MKICSKCKLPKNESEFSPRKTSKDGLHPHCKSCRRSFANAAYKNNPQKFLDKIEETKEKLYTFVDAIKAENGCKFCPEKTPICLDFHHLNPKEKDKSIAHLIAYKNKARIEAEIKKCIVVCANCHRKIHANLISIPV